MSTESEWRVLSREAILLTSEDDAQQYGLPKPLDAEASVRELLENRIVAKVEVDQASADFTIHYQRRLMVSG